MVFVDAASVRNIADIMNLTNTVKRKKVKNLAGSGSSPARKYRIKLKQIAMMSLTGASDITPAKASVNGWWKLRRILLLNDDKRMLTIRKSSGNWALTHKKHVSQRLASVDTSC